jgi:RNA polymerase sigma-70 factor (sigma-E family)
VWCSVIGMERVDVVGADSRPTTSTSDMAFDALFRAERARLVRLAFLLTGDRAQAEDVVQDAFLALHRRWPGLADPSTAAGYLRASVINGSRSVHRRRAVARRRAERPIEHVTSGADSDLLQAEEHRAVIAVLRQLSRRQQEVLVLRYWAGLSESEIAQTLGVSRGTVKTSASRGMKKLADRLGADRER